MVNLLPFSIYCPNISVCPQVAADYMFSLYSSQVRPSIVLPVGYVGQPLGIRDWSLITGSGGGYKIGKSKVQTFCAPPPSRQGNIFHAPSYKGGNFSAPLPFSMAKTTAYKLPQNLSCLPFSMAKTCSAIPRP